MLWGAAAAGYMLAGLVVFAFTKRLEAPVHVQVLVVLLWPLFLAAVLLRE